MVNVFVPSKVMGYEDTKLLHDVIHVFEQSPESVVRGVGGLSRFLFSTYGDHFTLIRVKLHHPELSK